MAGGLARQVSWYGVPNNPRGNPGASLFSAARLRMGRADFPLYHTTRKKSIRILHKLPAAFSPDFVQHYQLTFGAVCGILMMSRGDREHLFQVGLGTVCGGRKRPVKTLGKFQSSKKNVKNPLTNHQKYDTIRMSRGRQERTTSPQCVGG